MKKILFLLLPFIALLGFVRQNETDGIINALKKADAEQLSKYFDNFIDLKLSEKDELKNIGHNQATIALTGFFEDKKIKGFEVSSQREMGGIMYIAGKLQNNDKGYNLTIMLKTKDDKRKIISVRIN